MSKIVVAEDVQATPEMLRSIEGRYFLPGEKVRRLAKHGLQLEKSINTDLVITETRIMLGNDGDPAVFYSFEGLKGAHPSGDFGHSRDLIHHYGILIRRMGTTFLVPMDPTNASPTDALDAAVAIDGNLIRSARYAFGLGEADEDTAVFFASLETTPMIGEFHVLANGDGSAALAYSSWWSECSPAEISIAEAVIAAVGYSARPAVLS